MDYPTFKKAKELLEQANRMNPGPWYQHSLYTGIAAKNIAKKCSWLDAEKAQILGTLHDIGRRNGVTHLKHTVDGYSFCMSLGYDAAAKICLTHSFLIKNINEYFGENDCSVDEVEFIKNYLAVTEYDDYDRLIQLCDTLAMPAGFCLMEKRMVDVALRYGASNEIIPKWRAVFEIKEYFESKINGSIYNLLPGVVENTFDFEKEYET